MRCIGSYVLLSALWAIALACGRADLAIAVHLASRLAYVVWVGVSLRAEEREHAFTRRLGSDGGFLRFRRAAGVLMNNDAITLALAAWVTRGTLPWMSTGLTVAVGLALLAIGISMKLWAVSAVGRGAFYWVDFFTPPKGVGTYTNKGPYRFLRDPMHTIGYAHAYGLALVLRSWPGLLLAAFDHVCILLFCRVVEHPHAQRVYGRE